MWNVGSLVYYSHKNSFEKCDCIHCLRGSNWYGIITEAWTDEDDTTAIMVDFYAGTFVFRQSEHMYLRTINVL